MREDRELIAFARAGLGPDLIAKKLGKTSLSVYEAAKRLGIDLGPRPTNPPTPARRKAK